MVRMRGRDLIRGLPFLFVARVFLSNTSALEKCMGMQRCALPYNFVWPYIL